MEFILSEKNTSPQKHMLLMLYKNYTINFTKLKFQLDKISIIIILSKCNIKNQNNLKHKNIYKYKVINFNQLNKVSRA